MDCESKISLNKFPDYLVINIEIEGKSFAMTLPHEVARQARDQFISFYPYEPENIYVSKFIPFERE
jgi:hypothetical protein